MLLCSAQKMSIAQRGLGLGGWKGEGNVENRQFNSSESIATYA